MKKRIFVGFGCIILVLLLCFVMPRVDMLESLQTSTDSRYENLTLIIDAGHGGLTNTID